MPIEHSNEVDLIQQTLAGDTAAFDRLVKAHRTTGYTLVLSYTKNPADAEDLTQRIFIRAYERLATLRQLDRFLPWLQRITHNTCKDWIRRQGDITISFEEMDDTDFTETAPSAEDIALKREIEAIVQEAIGTLTDTDRKLVEGRYIDGASYDQLQVESGLSYAAIANRLKRAKQQLRRRIEKLLGGMAILPGRTLISGGIETVKLSVKTKLAAVGIVALIGIGGGALYYHTFELNPVVVNEQRVSEPEAVTEDASTVESSQPPSEADIEAAIAALESLDTTERRKEGVESYRKNFEASEEQAEPTQSKIASETKNSSTKISSELEAMFLYVKELGDRNNAIDAEMHPYFLQLFEIQDSHAAVGEKLGEAGINDEMKQKLYEELQRLDGEMKAKLDIIQPYKQQMEELEAELVQKYGLSWDEFAAQYYEAYSTWWHGL